MRILISTKNSLKDQKKIFLTSTDYNTYGINLNLTDTELC